MDEDADMADTAGLASQQQQNHSKTLTEQELEEKYPHRPHNHGKTFPFHELFTTLFNPLLQNRQKPAGPAMARKKQGPHGPSTLTPGEARRQLIERFIARWRKDVGDDIFPAFRLIIPDRDRERSMYGLKEKTIGKLLVKILRIDKHSEDGYNLINWKLPGQKATSSSTGDFAGRCYDVLRKRALKVEFGDMTVADVNQKLDELSLAGKESDQQPILEEFYNRMNAEEMLWLIRLILRQMKIGATEKTFFDIWHPDAETLFNISSNLRRVCWELYDPGTRLAGDNADITLMQCFQPQLAQFQMHDMEKLVQKMRPTETDRTFWIEDKLDGERMQLHMVEDPSVPGGKRFAFWSRKAKDYTYLYGNGFFDDNSALTRHLKDAFDSGVRNIILDGEMITWNPVLNKIVGFGTLKTAALSEQKNPFGTGERPVYRVFDILLLNDAALTSFTLRERRKALEAAIHPVTNRLEIHEKTEATTAREVEDLLRKVIDIGAEGLVLKNPRAPYRLNERNDDWMKVKPEYMTEYGEDLDCLVLGGYFGSGKRGGNHSSFMCGLRYIGPGTTSESMKFYSFFKVGGGFSAADYATIRHQTEGKWHDWDPKRPPTEYIELGGEDRQFERPDQWIRPDESFVISVKAASTGGSPQFRANITLRFPRFKSMRPDKDWKTALTIPDFFALKQRVDQEVNDKKLVIDDARRKKRKASTRQKKALVVAGAATEEIRFADNDFSTHVFDGLSFYIMSPSDKPVKKEKAELEALVKHHGGSIFQSPTAASNIICIADRNVVKVASMVKRGEHSIFRPIWLFDCINQARRDAALAGTASVPLVLPFERDRHVFFAAEKDLDTLDSGIDAVTGQGLIAVDEFNDSYARDVADVDELRSIFAGMPASTNSEEKPDPSDFMEELQERGYGFEGLSGWMFQGCVAWFDQEEGSVRVKEEDEMDLDGGGVPSRMQTRLDLSAAENLFLFAGGIGVEDTGDEGITHIVVSSAQDPQARTRQIRTQMNRTRHLPRIVNEKWIEESWNEKTLLDAERFAP